MKNILQARDIQKVIKIIENFAKFNQKYLKHKQRLKQPNFSGVGEISQRVCVGHSLRRKKYFLSQSELIFCSVRSLSQNISRREKVSQKTELIAISRIEK